jgi:eukaryotic translation initiation factor 2C
MQSTTRVDLQTLDAYLHHDGSGPQPEMPRNAIQVLEILIRHVPALLFTTVGRNSYYLKDRPGQSIRDGLMVHLGWFQSIRPACRQLVLNLDVSATAFYEVESVDKLVAHFFGAQSVMPLWRNLKPAQATLVTRFLRGINAELNYQPAGQRRRYKITGVDTLPAGQRQVPYGPDETEHPPNETVAQYYMRVHGIRLQFPEVPCVTSGQTRTLYLPMELVTVRAGQRHLGQLKPEQLAEMIKVTSTTPDDRLRRIVDGDVSLHRQPQIASFLQNWGLQIEDKLMQITGRVLPLPNVTIGQKTVQPRDGAWSAPTFAQPAATPLERWSICIVDARVGDTDRRALDNFRRVLVEILVKKGMKVPNTQPPIVDGTRHGTNLRDMLIEAGKSALGSAQGGGVPPQLVVCILSKKNTPAYPELKRVAETELGLMTQCIAMPNLTKDRGIEMYVDNVSLKINAKLGGINSFLDPARELTSFAGNIPTMLIGADVTHPRPGSHGRSIAAVVGSMDRRFCQYHAVIRSQTTRAEIINEMKGAIVQLLNAFYSKARVFPQRVIFFRDGVSEGQYNEVVLKEVREFKQACEEVGAGKVSMTFIVVTKRHHARFVPVNREDGDRRNGNAVPGTTIDNSVVHAFAFDYYQFGSQGLLGTSRPAHYAVLYDEHNFDADTLQELTFRLCHLYARCNKSVSLVPPVAYAHLVAARARYYAPETGHPSASVSEKPQSQQPQQPQQQAQLPSVKAVLADKMYFT